MKKYNGHNVTGKEMRNFKGSLKDGIRGIFITTADYDNNAREVAKESKIRTINGEELCHLLIEYNIGVEEKVTYNIKKIDESYFDGE
jgi:restriction system protein